MSTPFWPVTFSAAPYKQRGIQWDVVKKPTFKTVKQVAVTGREARIPSYSRALYEFVLKYEVLQDWGDALSNDPLSFPYNELRVVLGFYAARKGAFEPFFFPDPWDHRTVGETLSASTPGSGSDPTNPTGRNFQLVRTYGGTTEPVGGMNIGVMGEAVPVVKVNGTPVTFQANTVFDSIAGATTPCDGWICLDSAPSSGSLLTADFSFFYKVRFEDSLEFHTFMRNLWDVKQFTLTEVWY